MLTRLKQKKRQCTCMELTRLVVSTLRGWGVVLQRCGGLWLIGLMLGISVNPAGAATHNGEVSHLIGVFQGHVDRAVLYIAPYPGAIPSDPRINEEDLPSTGCKFEIDQEGTDELIDILKAGQINSDGPEKLKPVVAARTAIFIYQNKKRVMTMLVLADPLPNEDFMRGVWNRGGAVTTGPHLQSALRAFAKKLPPLSTHPDCANN